MAWMWARIKARSTRLGTFEGGFQNFADMFADRLREMGVEIRLGAQVKSITARCRLRGLVVDAGQDRRSFDKVLVTTSPALLAKLCPDLPASYLKGLLELKSMGAVVMVLSLKHQLSEQGYYWFNLPKEAGYPFLALVEHTNFVGPEHFGGDHIVYAGDYLEAGHEYFSMSDEQLLERFMPAFKKFNPSLRDGLDQEGLGLPDQLRPARAAGESFEEYPRHPDAHRGAVFRLDEPGLSVGSRHELRGGDRKTSTQRWLPASEWTDALPGRQPEVVSRGHRPRRSIQLVIG